MELGRQVSDNFRNTAFFTSLGSNVTTVMAPLANPITTLPVTFRQSATDADNHLVATVGAAYLQDQLELTPALQPTLERAGRTAQPPGSLVAGGSLQETQYERLTVVLGHPQQLLVQQRQQFSTRDLRQRIAPLHR